MIELRNVTKEYSKGNSALNGVICEDRTGRIRFYRRRQWFGKVYPDSSLIMKELNPT